MESSSFWKEENGERTRCDDWYVYYCQVAEHLSKQGYIVFVSCHPVVREYLAKYSSEKVCAIFPSLSIKKDWIKRLEDRYNNSKSDKDLRALQQAEKCYKSDIEVLYNECSYAVEWYSNAICIDNINYDLRKLIELL